MCEAPLFHHRPRPLVADSHARRSLSPARIRFFRSCVIALPLPPEQCPQLVSDPAIELFEYTLHFGEPEVRNPAPQNGIEPLDRMFHASAACLPQRLADFLRKPLTALLRDLQLRFLVPRHAVAQKFSLPRTRHRAFCRIDLQLQSLLQKRGDRRHHALPTPLASDIDIAVSSPGELHPEAL